MSDATRPRPLAPVVLIGLLVLAGVGAALRGPLERRPVPARTETGSPAAPDIAIPTLATPPEASPIPEEALLGIELPSWLSTAFWTVLALAVALIIGLVLRRLLANRRGPLTVPPPASVAGQSGITPGADAPDLTEPIAQAKELLRGGGPPRDAVISAWVALEEGASRRGAARAASETPTEFTEYIVASTPVDAAAVAQLRARYLAARFGTAPVTTRDVELAAAALDRIEETWSR